MHVMKIIWEFDDRKELYYRNSHGLQYLCDISLKNQRYYVKTDIEKQLHQEMVIPKEGELVHLLHIQGSLESHLYTYQEEIKIGRDQNCQIQIQSPYISLVHGSIHIDQNKITIKDAGSRNGIYLNQKRIDLALIKLYDIIHLPYVYLIFHHDFLLISSVKEYVHVHLNAYIAPDIKPWKRDYIRLQKEIVVANQLPELLVSIKAPPQIIDHDRPLWMTLIPSIAMGLSAVMMCVSAFQNDSLLAKLTSIAMGAGMFVSSVILPLIIHYGQHKENQKKNQDQIKAYEKYYDEKRLQIETLQKNYLKLYEQKQVNTIEAMLRITSFKHLWSKDEKSEDALSLVLGEWTQSLPWKIEGSELPLKLHYSSLEQKYQSLLDMKHQSIKMSFSFDLLQARLLGIYGVEGLGYALQLLLQLSALHDYRALHIWIVSKEENFAKWGLSFLPHVFQGDGFRRLLSTKEDLIQFQHHLRIKKDKALELLFLADDDLASFLTIDTLLEEIPTLSLIQYASTHQKLSSLCTHVIHVSKNEQATYFHDHMIPFTYAYVEIEKLQQLYKRLSFVRWQSEQLKPKSFGFLALYGCDKIEQLQVEKRWTRPKRMDSLAITLGYDAYQEKIILNVHEKGHGPHGVIAGMTGSGKSELLMTLILSLCVQYASHEVSFILIDYKGGMSASAFKELPHITYIMSNLNDQSIRRVSLSLEAELERRQRLFKQCAYQNQLSVVDMDKYWELVYEGKCEAIPHLFVIADEFAELKTSQETFLKLLKKISRIGRSLGIHLILATQKPSGIIDDEILSNARFRICLKVAYTQDSNDVLKHEDAAFLKEAGSFYLQVGNDEMYIQGRCSYTQQPYYASNQAYDKRVIFHHANGKPYLSKQFLSNQPKQSQLQAIVGYLSNLAKQLHFTSFHFCEAELTMKQQCLFHQNKQIYLGEVDDVRFQCRHPFYLDEHKNQLILGKKGSGKQLFIETIVYEYARLHRNTCIYILSANQNELADLKQYLIVADVIDVQHSEAYQSFLYQMKHRSISKKIIIIISLYERILEAVSSFGDDFMILRNKADQIILSGFTSISIPYRWLPYFEHRHLLQMEEKSEYQCLQNGDDVFPQNTLGSGITLYHHRPLLFQLYPYAKHLKLQLPQGESEFRIPLLPKHILMKFKYRHLYLGKHLDSKEDIFIQQQPIIVCAQYEIPRVFYRYVEVYESKYQEKLDISFYCLSQWKNYQYDEAFQQRIKNASFIFAGSGLLECLYALPLPASITRDLTNQQLICYTSQSLSYVAMMEETDE